MEIAPMIRENVSEGMCRQPKAQGGIPVSILLRRQPELRSRSPLGRVIRWMGKASKAPEFVLAKAKSPQHLAAGFLL